MIILGQAFASVFDLIAFSKRSLLIFELMNCKECLEIRAITIYECVWMSVSGASTMIE